MFKFTLESTKDVKSINIVFGDDTSDVVVDNTAQPAVSASEPVTTSNPDPEPAPQPKKSRAEKAAAPAYDPFDRASKSTGYGTKERKAVVAVEPEVVEDISERPDKVDLDFGNSSF